MYVSSVGSDSRDTLSHRGLRVGGAGRLDFEKARGSVITEADTAPVKGCKYSSALVVEQKGRTVGTCASVRNYYN